MIIGNGLIANAFKNFDREDVVFFASGVSNSLETNKENFHREEKLVQDTIRAFPDALFVYFSTCSIYDSSKAESPYVLHKLRMESLVSSTVGSYLILRVSNAVGGGGNPNLLVNFLYQKLMKDEPISVLKSASRNLIDVEDVKNITLELIKNHTLNTVVNVAYLQEFTIKEILDIFNGVLQKKPKIVELEGGINYKIHLDYAKTYMQREQKTDKKAYLRGILQKYYI